MSTGDGTVQWVWPPLETEDPPPIGEFDGGFGPVYLNDQIVLLFSPSSYTGDLTWYCDWAGKHASLHAIRRLLTIERIRHGTRRLLDHR
jgi:hypothetical protein